MYTGGGGDDGAGDSASAKFHAHRVVLADASERLFPRAFHRVNMAERHKGLAGGTLIPKSIHLRVIVASLRSAGCLRARDSLEERHEKKLIL